MGASRTGRIGRGHRAGVALLACSWLAACGRGAAPRGSDHRDAGPDASDGADGGRPASYAIVYLRYPRTTPQPNASGGTFRFGHLDDAFDPAAACYGEVGSTGAVRCPDERRDVEEPTLPEVRDLYSVTAGGDLVLLRADGSERVLVAHDETRPYAEAVGSVLDLAVDPDAQYVAYAEVHDARPRNDDTNDVGRTSRIDVYRMFVGDEQDPRFGVPACVTCDLGHALDRFHGYDPSLDDDAVDALAEVAHLAPAFLSDGRIVFATTHFAEAMSGLPNLVEERVDFFGANTAQATTQLAVVDPDGANLHRITPASLGRAQHPAVLADGRIVYTAWDVAMRRRVHNGFDLWQVRPDGQENVAFSHRHQRKFSVPHFVTGLPDGRACAVEYYNGESYGFGALLCFPSDPPGPDFTDVPSLAFPSRADQIVGSGLGQPVEVRFDGIDGRRHEGDTYPHLLTRNERVGQWYVTPTFSNFDHPTRDFAGKVTQPSPAPGGDVLIVFSPGGVAHSTGGALPGPAMPLPDAGIYRILAASLDDARGVRSVADLVRVRDDPAYHEMVPRALVPMRTLFATPPPVPSAPSDARPYGYLTGASVRTRLTRPDDGDAPRGRSALETNGGGYAWHTQGTEAGVVSDDAIVGLRVLAIVPQGLSRPFEPSFPNAQPYQRNNRGWYAPILDRAYVLGEVSVRKRDADGNLLMNPDDLGTSGVPQPDTSFRLRVPADLPIFLQALDADGLATATETAWHHVAPGETKACVGCHARTVERPSLADSLVGLDPERYEVDLTGDAPLVVGTDARGDLATASAGERLVAVDFASVGAIFERACTGCHGGGAPAAGLVLDASLATYERLFYPTPGDAYALPQVSRWVRVMQARQSLLVWYAFGRRLDGRPDAGDPGRHPGEVDWVFAPTTNHAGFLTDAERRTLARYVDLGAPIDLGAHLAAVAGSAAGWRSRRGYLVDDLPPIVTVGGLLPTHRVCAGTVPFAVGVWDDDADVVLSATLDGVAIPLVPGGDTYGGTIGVSTGDARLVVTAVDGIGNRTRVERTLRVAPCGP